MEFLGKLTATKSTFEKTQRVVTSEKLGIVVKLNVNDFATDEQCEQFALLISKAPEHLQELINEIELLKRIKKQLDDLGGSMEFEVEERITELEQLIKEATEL